MLRRLFAYITLQVTRRFQTEEDIADRILEDRLVNEILAEYDNNLSRSVSDDLAVFENHGAEIRCFAHTLQLAVISATKDSCPESISLIQLCRTVAKQLWSLSIREMLIKAKIKINLPPKECVTRWSSMFMMVCYL